MLDKKIIWIIKLLFFLYNYSRRYGFAKLINVMFQNVQAHFNSEQLYNWTVPNSESIIICVKLFYLYFKIWKKWSHFIYFFSNEDLSLSCGPGQVWSLPCNIERISLPLSHIYSLSRLLFSYPELVLCVGNGYCD